MNALADAFEAARRVGDALDALDVRWYVGGSVASTFRGVPRATMDLDLVADLQLTHVDALVSALEPQGYIDADTVREAVRRRGCFNVIDEETLVKVDVFCGSRAPRHLARYDRVTREAVGDTTIPVCAAEDIIIAKLDWYDRLGRTSDRQWSDVQGVLKTQGTALNRPLLERLAAEEGLSELLTQALRDAGV